MYRVALCEDEKMFSEAQEGTCRAILDKLDIEYDITVYDNSADLLHAYLEEGKRYDLLLLDIIMDGINGIELAEKIRSYDQEAIIIFITFSKEFALRGYDVNALHYLLKPVDADVLERLITSVYHKKFKQNFLALKSGAQKLLVSINEIIVLEIVGRRKVSVTLADKTYCCLGKLSEILDELPKGKFVRCHQSFAVNINCIRELDRQRILTVNGLTVPVSRTFYKDVQSVFIEQIRGS